MQYTNEINLSTKTFVTHTMFNNALFSSFHIWPYAFLTIHPNCINCEQSKALACLAL